MLKIFQRPRFFQIHRGTRQEGTGQHRIRYSIRRLLTENFEVNFSDWWKAITEITCSQLKYDVNRILIPKINNRVIDFNLLEKQKDDDW